MALGVQLDELMDQLKFEAGISSNIAHGVAQRDTYKHMLRRTQKELWAQHLWPHLAIRKALTLGVGQRYYNYPDGLTFDQISDMRVWVGGELCKLGYGIGADELAVSNSDAGVSDNLVRRWQHYAENDQDNQLEVWPIPAVSQQIMVFGQRALRPLVQDSDTCTLDDTLIVLYAAAEILARAKNEDASLKLDKAKAHFRMLKAREGSNKTSPIIIGGGHDGLSRRGTPRPGIDYIPAKG